MTQAQRYSDMIAPHPHGLDNFYRAALYLLSSNEVLTKAALKHISDEGSDFAAIKEDCVNLEREESQLLSIAHNLFNSTAFCAISPSDIANMRLPAFLRIQDAMRVAAGFVKIQIQEESSGAKAIILDDSPQKQVLQSYQMIDAMKASLSQES
jgi:hypothetical protein